MPVCEREPVERDSKFQIAITNLYLFTYDGDSYMKGGLELHWKRNEALHLTRWLTESLLRDEVLWHASKPNAEPSWLLHHRLRVVQAISTLLVVSLIDHDAIHDFAHVVAPHEYQNVVCLACGLVGLQSQVQLTSPRKKGDRLLVTVVIISFQFPVGVNPVGDEFRQLVQPEFQWWVFIIDF